MNNTERTITRCSNGQISSVIDPFMAKNVHLSAPTSPSKCMKLVIEMAQPIYDPMRLWRYLSRLRMLHNRWAIDEKHRLTSIFSYLFLFLKPLMGHISASSRATGILKALLHVLLFMTNPLISLVLSSDTEKLLKSIFRALKIRVLSKSEFCHTIVLGRAKSQRGCPPHFRPKSQSVGRSVGRSETPKMAARPPKKPNFPVFAPFKSK